MASNKFDKLMSVGIVIGKDTFHIVGFDPDGHLVMGKQIKRQALIAALETLPRCIVEMEACLATVFLGRPGWTIFDEICKARLRL